MQYFTLNTGIIITTVGWVLIAWFNDCVLGKSGQITIMNIDPVRIIVHEHVYVCDSINNIIVNVGKLAICT